MNVPSDHIVTPDERLAVINALEALGITPQKGVYVLVGCLYGILETNGYSKVEMCRHINEAIMRMVASASDTIQ